MASSSQGTVASPMRGNFQEGGFPWDSLPMDVQLRVLSHLIDDGLHECRRVCRSCREACRKLPVHLSISELDHLHQLAQEFPHAASLSLTTPQDLLPLIQNLDALQNLTEFHLLSQEQEVTAVQLVTLMRSVEGIQSLTSRHPGSFNGASPTTAFVAYAPRAPNVAQSPPRRRSAIHACTQAKTDDSRTFSFNATAFNRFLEYV